MLSHLRGQKSGLPERAARMPTTWHDARVVSLPLPDPMTIGIVGACAGVPVAMTSGVFACLPESKQGRSGEVGLWAALIGGLVGLVAWLLGLLGLVEQASFFLPEKRDLFGFVSCATSLAVFVSGLVLVYCRYWRGVDIDIVRWSKIAGMVWLLAFIVLYASVPSLQS